MDASKLYDLDELFLNHYDIYEDYLQQLETEREWFQKYCLIETGKLPSESMNVKFLPKLSPKAEAFGLTAKMINMILSLDSANENIVEAYHIWELGKNIAPETLIFNTKLWRKRNSLNSYIIQEIRRFIDDAISICWVLSQQGTVQKIEIDSIGSYLKKRNVYKEFDDFYVFFTLVNNISNAYKHSFSNNMETRVGREEPYICALDSNRNKEVFAPYLIEVSLRELISDFNCFYHYTFNLIEKKCCE